EGAQTLAVLVPQPPDGFPAADDRLRSRLTELGDELRGERGEAVVVRTDGPRVVAAGIGERDRIDLDALPTAAAATGDALARAGGTLTWLLDESLPLSVPDQARAPVE